MTIGVEIRNFKFGQGDDPNKGGKLDPEYE